MIFQYKKVVLLLAITFCTTNLFGIKGETKTFAYLAGSQCASDMVTNLTELSRSRVKEPICIEEFLDRYSYSLQGYTDWELFLKGFYQQFRVTDVQKTASGMETDRFLKRLFVRGHQIVMELFPHIIKQGENWFTEETDFIEFFRRALMKAAEEKYGRGSKLCGDADYIERSFWKDRVTYDYVN